MSITSITCFPRFLVAGFYYKTFMWPAKAWMFYESIIRRAAGLGTATREFDPDRYDKLNGFCDVLVVGGGPAGLSSALAFAKQGKKVIIADEQTSLGGMLRYQGDDEKQAWANEMLDQLNAMDNVNVMPSTTVFGAYDGGCYGAVEQARQDNDYSPRLRYHRIYAQNAVYACGAMERPIVFGNNDLPGVMLAYALSAYVNYYGVVPDKNIVIFTNNDSVYELATQLLNLGSQVTVVDSRADHELSAQLRDSGAMVYTNAVVADARGRLQVNKVSIYQQGITFEQDCDMLAMSGGWTPTVHLQSHLGSKPIFDDELLTINLTDLKTENTITVGSAAGIWDHDHCVRSGEMAADGETAQAFQSNSNATQALYYVPQSKGKSLVDYQNDVALPDIQLAEREGYRSVEHVKRYTTLGMATDQGKTANINALGILGRSTWLFDAASGYDNFQAALYTSGNGCLCGPLSRSAFCAFKTNRHASLARAKRCGDAECWTMANDPNIIHTVVQNPCAMLTCERWPMCAIKWAWWM